MEIDEDAINRDIAVVSKLDDFCCSGEFTSWVGEFQNTNCSKFTLDEDQPIECYEIFKDYEKQLETHL